jgi:hypothetical protein
LRELASRRSASLFSTLGIIFSLAALYIGFVFATLFSRSLSRSVGGTTRAISDLVSEDITALTEILERLAAGRSDRKVCLEPQSAQGNRQRRDRRPDRNALAEALGVMAIRYTSIRPRWVTYASLSAASP